MTTKYYRIHTEGWAGSISRRRFFLAALFVAFLALAGPLGGWLDSHFLSWQFPASRIEAAYAHEGHDHSHDEDTHAHDADAEAAEAGHVHSPSETQQPGTEAAHDHDVHSHDHSHAGEEAHDHGHENEAGHDHDHDHPASGSESEAHDHDHEEGVVEVPAHLVSALGIKTESVQKQDLVQTLDLYGWIRPRPQDRTDIHSPLEGTVEAIHAWPGDFVKSGSPVLELSIPGWFDWQKDVLHLAHTRERVTDLRGYGVREGHAEIVQLLGEIQVAHADSQRLEKQHALLSEAGSQAVSRKELETNLGSLNLARITLHAKESLARSYGIPEAVLESIKAGGSIEDISPEVIPPKTRTSIREADFDLEEAFHYCRLAEAKLLSVGFPVEKLELLRKGDLRGIAQTLVVSSPADGLVSRLNVTVKMAVSPEKDLIEIIDYHTVLIETEVPEVDIQRVLNRYGDQVAVRFPGLPDVSSEARVLYFDTSVHPDIRKAHLVLELDNLPGLLLRDQMAASVGVPLAVRENALSVPRKSILTDGFEKIVFVEDHGHFHRTPITNGIANLDRTEVLSGLENGSRVVTDGARVLFLALKAPKGMGDPHAGHSH